MTNEGFNNQTGIDRKAGFIYGGNQWNCGTWMDKMGSNDKANNKGYLATLRDGSAIDLIALARTIISWIIQMNKQGYYPYNSIDTTSLNSEDKIRISFEKEFWIDQTNSSKYVNRKQIYKDTINSTWKWTDFQLRPNFLITAVVAPEMFDKTHIWLALKQVEQILLGKLVIMLMMMSRMIINEHMVLIIIIVQNGYYIRAKLYWSKQQNDPLIVEQTRKYLEEIVSAHMELILSNDWKGLLELTNANGKLCSHSYSVQAWSSATLLDALYDLTQCLN
ncbi:unnamed protein product [Adineta steineri]|uniref:Glycogen debranching enzyme C-terminal domain-containing protein n=1 Tax=Adineta steineri TaxID=433720 RepID=A0A813VLY1_9BILA|nr:unnamed protein product [Adineta steineri]CAF1096640.1 unnamed protein product [Adineta steineri]